MAEQGPESHLSGFTAPAFGSMCEVAEEPKQTRNKCERKEPEAVPVAQAKSPRKPC